MKITRSRRGNKFMRPFHTDDWKISLGELLGLEPNWSLDKELLVQN